MTKLIYCLNDGQKGIWLKCTNTKKQKKCGKVWFYKGKSKFYATCPGCYNKVNIEKAHETYKTNRVKNAT